MATTFTLSQEQYEALISLAQKSARRPDGGMDHEQALVLDAFLKDIERSNNIIRHSLWVQWQDPTQPLPPGVRFPKTWPPNLRYFIQFLSRSISREDVLGYVTQRTPNAVNIMVTPDPGATLGWTAVDSYFPPP